MQKVFYVIFILLLVVFQNINISEIEFNRDRDIQFEFSLVYDTSFFQIDNKFVLDELETDYSNFEIGYCNVVYFVFKDTYIVGNCIITKFSRSNSYQYSDLSPPDKYRQLHIPYKFNPVFI